MTDREPATETADGDAPERQVADPPPEDAPSDDGWTDPYRWACPRGHVFQRSFDPAGQIECYTCQRTYDAAELVDRRADSPPPSWRPRD